MILLDSVELFSKATELQHLVKKKLTETNVQLNDKDLSLIYALFARDNFEGDILSAKCPEVHYYNRVRTLSGWVDIDLSSFLVHSYPLRMEHIHRDMHAVHDHVLTSAIESSIFDLFLHLKNS